MTVSHYHLFKESPTRQQSTKQNQTEKAYGLNIITEAEMWVETDPDMCRSVW